MKRYTMRDHKMVAAGLLDPDYIVEDGQLRIRGGLRRRKPVPPAGPGGLKTMAEVAIKLGCSIKTVKNHVDSGMLKHVDIGRGSKRPSRRFIDSDIAEFIANQTRKDVPACPSTRILARRTGSSISSAEVIDFTAPRRQQPNEKPRK
jgi:hypothetical protein